MPTSETLTDVSGLVDGCFDELECISETGKVAHSGDQAAYMVWHGCHAGIICRNHFNFTVTEIRRAINQDIDKYGFAVCGYCMKKFATEESFMKLYPL